MRILLWDRRAGKTHECIKLMREDPDAICIVPLEVFRNTYPEDLHDRIYSIQSNGWKHRHTKVILDNVEKMKDDQLNLVSRTNDVILATSTPRTWLSRMIKRYGYEDGPRR